MPTKTRNQQTNCGLLEIWIKWICKTGMHEITLSSLRDDKQNGKQIVDSHAADK